MKSKKTLNVRQLGAVGDGAADDTAAIQAALDGASLAVIPDGDYRITATLKIPSNTSISASMKARIFLCGETPKKRGDFLLSNSDPVNGNENISLSGGVWDGNNTGRCNIKADLFDPNGYSGAVLNLSNMRGLTLRDMTVANPASFYVRMNMLDSFDISKIRFLSAEPRPNQDGLHFAGNVRNGRISSITALTSGQPNDDMIAFNADDSIVRVENLDLSRGPIENITVEDVSAENCYTFLRFLSVDAPIRNIKIKNVRGSCRVFAVNMDSARYCRTPLFSEGDFPNGVGNIENVEIEDMSVWHVGDKKPHALILCESQVKNFKITGFSCPAELDSYMDVPTLLVRNVTGTAVSAVCKNGEISAVLNFKSDRLSVAADITEIRIN